MKVALACCAVTSLVATASAGAATATITNGGGASGTATSGVLFTFSSRTVGCTTAAATATLAGATGTLPLTISTDFQPLFPAPGGVSCVIIGGLRATVSCGLSTLRVTGVTSGGITPVSLSGISCDISVTGSSPVCRNKVSGSVNGQFDNATSKLTILASGQSLAATGSTLGGSGTCAVLPNGSPATLTSTTGGNIDYVVRQVSSGSAVGVSVV